MVSDRNPAESLISYGVKGPSTRDLALIRRAIKSDWDLTEDIKQTLPGEMMKIVKTEEDVRSKINAARVLVAMDAANVNRQKVDNGTTGVTVNVGVNVDNRSIVTVDERNSRIASICRAALERQGASGDKPDPGATEDSILPTQPDSEASGVPVSDV